MEYETSVNRKFLQLEVESLRKKVIFLKQELSRRKLLKNDLENELNHCTEKMFAVRSEIQTKEKHISVFEGDLSQLNDEITKIQKDFEYEKHTIEGTQEMMSHQLNHEIDECQAEINRANKYQTNKEQLEQNYRDLEENLHKIHSEFDDKINKKKEKFTQHKLILKQQLLEKLFKNSLNHTVKYINDRKSYLIRFMKENNELEKRITAVTKLKKPAITRRKRTYSYVKVMQSLDNLNLELVNESDKLLKEITKITSYCEQIQVETSAFLQKCKKKRLYCKRIKEAEIQKALIDEKIGNQMHFLGAASICYKMRRAYFKRIRNEYDKMLKIKKKLCMLSQMVLNFKERKVNFIEGFDVQAFQKQEIQYFCRNCLNIIAELLNPPYVSSEETILLDILSSEASALETCKSIQEDLSVEEDDTKICTKHTVDLVKWDEHFEISEESSVTEIKLCDIFDVESNESQSDFEEKVEESEEVFQEVDEFDDESDQSDNY